jgi:hypothetical protein
MLPYQERVVAEKKELDEKIEKLDTFLAGSFFPTLPSDQKELLRLQRIAMTQYSSILCQRVENFAETVDIYVRTPQV